MISIEAKNKDQVDKKQQKTLSELLAELQSATWLSDEYITRLKKKYPEQIEKKDPNLFLGLEIYHDLNDNEDKGTKAVETLIDQPNLKFEDLIAEIVEFWLAIKETKKDLAVLKTSKEYEAEIKKLTEELTTLQSEPIKVTIDDEARNTAIEKHIANPAEKIVTAYMSTKEVPYPDIIAYAKGSYIAQKSEFKDATQQELIEETDKVTWKIIKDLKLDKQKAAIVKQINYKTLTEIVKKYIDSINKELFIKVKKIEKIKDRAPWNIGVPTLEQSDFQDRYDTKVAKAVVDYSIQKVFWEKFLKKSKSAKVITSETDAVNILAQYMTSWDKVKNPELLIKQDAKIQEKWKTIQEEQKKILEEEANKEKTQSAAKIQADIDKIQKLKEEAENKELNEVVQAIEWITWNFEVKDIKSVGGESGDTLTLCSAAACFNIKKLIKYENKKNNEDERDEEIYETNYVIKDTEDAKPIFKGHADDLIVYLRANNLAQTVKLESFTKEWDIQKLKDNFNKEALISKWSVLDMYVFSKYKYELDEKTQKMIRVKHSGHDRLIAFLDTNGEWNILNPFYQAKTPKSVDEYFKNFSKSARKNEIVINNTTYAQIDSLSQKRLQEAYKKVANNEWLAKKVSDRYGSDEIISILAKYDQSTPYEDKNIEDLPKEEISETTTNNNPSKEEIKTPEKKAETKTPEKTAEIKTSEKKTETVKVPEKVEEGFTLEILKAHVPKIYDKEKNKVIFTYEDLYTAIMGISDKKIKYNCIQEIKKNNIAWFQEALWMKKNDLIENRADGKIWTHTLEKIRQKNIQKDITQE